MTAARETFPALPLLLVVLGENAPADLPALAVAVRRGRTEGWRRLAALTGRALAALAATLGV